MTTDKAITMLRNRGIDAVEFVDQLEAWDRNAHYIVLPVYFEQSPTDGFAIAHVDGKAVVRWLSGH